MRLDFTKDLFSSDASSLKVIMKITDTKTYNTPNAYDQTFTYPHGYANDDLIVVGRTVVSSSVNPSQQDGFTLPYLDATGIDLVVAEWDATNVYVRITNGGSINNTATVTVSYTLLVIVP